MNYLINNSFTSTKFEVLPRKEQNIPSTEIHPNKEACKCTGPREGMSPKPLMMYHICQSYCYMSSHSSHSACLSSLSCLHSFSEAQEEEDRTTWALDPLQDKDIAEELYSKMGEWVTVQGGAHLAVL
jgi:hypothetical protein